MKGLNRRRQWTVDSSGNGLDLTNNGSIVFTGTVLSVECSQ